MDNIDAEDVIKPLGATSGVIISSSDINIFTGETRLKATMNDLPDEIILRVMSYEFVILGSDMFIFDFPGAAAVCQKWFLIYFDMYWRKWGFLKSRRATLDQWIRLARAKNGLYAMPIPKVSRPSSMEAAPVIIAPKSATPPPTMASRLIKDTKLESKEPVDTKSVSESSLSMVQPKRNDIIRLNTSDARAKDSTTRDAWKTVMRRGRKRSLKPATSAMEKIKEDKSKAKPKAVAFPFKILQIR